MSSAEKEFIQSVKQAAQEQAKTVEKVVSEQAENSKPKQVDVIKESKTVFKLVKQVSEMIEFVPDEVESLTTAVGKLNQFLMTLTTQADVEEAIVKFVDKVNKRCTKEVANQKELPMGANADIKQKTEFLKETEEAMEKWLDSLEKEEPNQ